MEKPKLVQIAVRISPKIRDKFMATKPDGVKLRYWYEAALKQWLKTPLKVQQTHLQKRVR
jgi:hypothetical protein